MTNPKLLRPINNVSILSKLIEKTVSTQLTKYLIEQNLVSQHLQGGIKGRSSTMNVLSLYDKLTTAAKNKLITALIASDQSAAYDMVNHEILYK